MPSFEENYTRNLFRLSRRDRSLDPLVVTYYLTTRCNLNCVYCEDFGISRNAQALPPLSFEQTAHILSVIRTGTDRLILTGGEPLLFSDIVHLTEFASAKLKFREITLLTNGLLLKERQAVLQHIQRLVISLDSSDPEFWNGVIRGGADSANQILENIDYAAKLQKNHPFNLIVNCVVSPQTLDGALALLEFCRDRSILVSYSPQSINNWPAYALLVSSDYQEFLDEVIRQKKLGAPILGSLMYYSTLRSFTPYACYPTLVPRVWPDGSLIYPCRPIEREGGSLGGRPVNLLNIQTWKEAVAPALERYGPPPEYCSSCFQQCFAEPSLMQSLPLAWLTEWVRFPASRRGHLATFAPG